MRSTIVTRVSIWKPDDLQVELKEANCSQKLLRQHRTWKGEGGYKYVFEGTLLQYPDTLLLGEGTVVQMWQGSPFSRTSGQNRQSLTSNDRLPQTVTCRHFTQKGTGYQVQPCKHILLGTFSLPIETKETPS